MRKLIVSLLVCCAMAFAQAAKAPAARPFTIKRPNAADLTLAAYRGKIVLLVFISTHCSHCQEFTEKLIPIAREYAPRGVQFIECAVNPDAKTDVPNFVRAFQPPFPVGYGAQDVVDAYLQRSPILTFYVPHTVFLSRTGRIVDDYPGESNFMKNALTNTRGELDKLLKAAAAPAKKTASPVKTAGAGSQ